MNFNIRVGLSNFALNLTSHFFMMYFRSFFLFLSFFLSLSAGAANILLENCETLSFNKARGANVQVLKGHVRFRHDQVVMYCDSAYFYSGQNSFDAYGHVRMVQDTITMNADKMFYDGNIKLIRVRGNVVMRSGKFRLTTQKLDFFRARGFAFYDEGAHIYDPSFTLDSRVGYYYPKSKDCKFKQNVVLNATDFKIFSDSLNYNSRSSIAQLHGPSTIFRDDYIITTRRAWMNNHKGIFHLYRRSRIEKKDNTQYLEADTIYYDRTKSTARAYGNIDGKDFTQHMAFSGGYGYFRSAPLRSALLTRGGRIIDFSSADTLFLHADTLAMHSEPNNQDRVLMGRHNVRFFRNDFQGVCNYMTYVTKDSVINMQQSPVLWSDQNQLTGDTVLFYLKNKHPDWLHILGSSLIVQRDDSINYNQLAGRELKGYFIANQLRKVDILGNAVSVYYPKDKKGDLVGVNRTEGAFMTININEKRKLDKIILQPGTMGTMYPPFQAPEGVERLKGFSWQMALRPKKPADIFLKNN